MTPKSKRRSTLVLRINDSAVWRVRIEDPQARVLLKALELCRSEAEAVTKRVPAFDEDTADALIAALLLTYGGNHAT